MSDSVKSFFEMEDKKSEGVKTSSTVELFENRIPRII